MTRKYRMIRITADTWDRLSEIRSRHVAKSCPAHGTSLLCSGDYCLDCDMILDGLISRSVAALTRSAPPTHHASHTKPSAPAKNRGANPKCSGRCTLDHTTKRHGKYFAGWKWCGYCQKNVRVRHDICPCCHARLQPKRRGVNP